MAQVSAASVASASSDISKLKVAELKKELKARGLSTGGNKNDLMERLHVCLQGEGSVMDTDLVVADAEEILDEDDVLADDDDIGDISGKTDDMMADLSALDSKRKVDDLEPEENKVQPTRKIILNRNTLITSEKENHEREQDARAHEKRVIKLSALSVKERLEMRAKKFGLSLSADAKKEARAARFGLSPSMASRNVSADVDVLRKRAERFGTSVSSIMNKVEQDEKMRKRQERFGIVQPASGKSLLSNNRSSLIDEKKRLRAERFKLAK